MSEPFLAEIRIVSFNFPPKGWAFCNGQLMPINQNQALFALLGTTYGGNGSTTFALPDMRGRTPIHVGPISTLGQRAGEEAHTITEAEMPTHGRGMQGTTDQATSTTPVGNVLAAKARFNKNVYALPGNLAALSPTADPSVGGGQAHDNMQPYLALSFVIALQGIFPSRN